MNEPEKTETGAEHSGHAETGLGALLRRRLHQVSPLRWVLASAVIAACGATIVLAQVAQTTRPKAPLPPVVLLQEPLPLDSQAAKHALARLRKHVSQILVLKLPESQQRRVSFGDLGVEIDKSHLVQLLKDAIDRTSPVSRVRRRRDVPGDAPLELDAPLNINPTRVFKVLRSIKAEHDRSPVDARLDLNKRQVLPSVEGLLLDLEASFKALEAALREGKLEVDLVFEHVPPSRRTEQLQGVRFEHVIAAFETHYDRSMRADARTHNLRVAANKLDGYVLLPGEVFDFNRIVGPRDESNGYKIAPVIAQGELVDGIGGGTCQISGTLHGAAFFAGLDIVERYPHTRPSSYIKLGLDATVVYPTINFRMKNPFDFPVVLHEEVKDGVVRAEILGPQTETSTTLIRRIDKATPYEEVERPDPDLPSGVRILAQRGVPGFRVRMYRINRRGAHATRERWLSSYPPTTQIVRVGTGSGALSSAPSGDSHPEYTADELLVVTRTPEHTKPDDLLERRQPGRYGSPGWTKAAGMPVFDLD